MLPTPLSKLLQIRSNWSLVIGEEGYPDISAFYRIGGLYMVRSRDAVGAQHARAGAHPVHG